VTLHYLVKYKFSKCVLTAVSHTTADHACKPWTECGFISCPKKAKTSRHLMVAQAAFNLSTTLLPDNMSLMVLTHSVWFLSN